MLSKADFWKEKRNMKLNTRQHAMLNVLLDDFFGKLTSAKWANMQKCSTDTALRDIQDLVYKGTLLKEDAGGEAPLINWRNPL